MVSFILLSITMLCMIYLTSNWITAFIKEKNKYDLFLAFMWGFGLIVTSIAWGFAFVCAFG